MQKYEKIPCPACSNLFYPKKGKQKYCDEVCEYNAFRTTSEPDPVPGATWVALTQGKFALVDDDDLEKVNKYQWTTYASRIGNTYAKCREKGNLITMHRLIMGDPPFEGALVDHKDPSRTLDNRKENLRWVTKSQNVSNTKARGSTGYSGVTAGSKNRFKAYLMHQGRSYHLGYFATAEEAARARDAKAREVQGEFGRYNFPLPGEASAI